MRSQLWISLAFAFAACSRSQQPVNVEYTIVVDSVAVAPVDHDGNAWCGSGVTPLVDVDAAVGGAEGTSAPAAGLQSTLSAPLVDTSRAQLESPGLLVEVYVTCGDVRRRAGAALVHADAELLANGGLELTHVGNIDDLRLHLVAAGGDVTALPATYVGVDTTVVGDGVVDVSDDGAAYGAIDNGDGSDSATGDDGSDGTAGDDAADDCGCDARVGRNGAATRARFPIHVTAKR